MSASLKKDYRKLVTEGTELASVSSTTTASSQPSRFQTVAHEHATRNGSPQAVLPYVLDAQRFSILPANDRRAFLFGLMSLRTDGDAVIGACSTRDLSPLG